ncbi:MAG: YraN family protein [Bacteroidota bacterium]|nr:YraN family protein [Bacteroidota bacterium]
MKRDPALARTSEDLAARHLSSLGYEILERNYRYGRGEIDIVAADGGTIVFVEVKARTSERFGSPETAVTAGKQRQLSRVALGWLVGHERSDVPCRFDIVAVKWSQGIASLRVIRNAFILMP